MSRHAWTVLVLVSACSLNAEGLGEGTTTQTVDTTSTGLVSVPASSGTSATPGTSTTGSETPALDSSSGGSNESGESSGGSSESSGGASESSGGEPVCDASPRWWNVDWSRRRRLTFDGSSVAEELTSVPIRVRLDSGRIDYAQVQEDGVDLRFIDEDLSTELAYEVEHWDEGGDSEVWLRLPVVPVGGMPTVWMYYGNAAAAPGEDPTGVWDSNFVSVHHLVDLNDATAQGHNGIGPNLPTDAEGRIGRGRFFDGADDQVELPQESDFDFDTALTVEAWAQVSSFTVGWQALITKGDQTWRMHRAGGSNQLGFGSNSMTGGQNLSGSTSINDGQWHHLVIAYGAGVKSIYVDGQLDGSVSFDGPLRETDAVVLLGNNADHLGRFFHGTMDEIRISDVERSAAWIDLQFRAMEDAGVVSVDAEQTCP